MEISLKRIDPDLPMPQHAHTGDGGVDLHAAEDAILPPGERCIVPTGIAVAIPLGYAGFVVPRSGLAARSGLSVVNAPGLVDSGYRGEIKVILVNLGQEVIELARGDRIAQLVVVAVEEQVFVEVDELPDSPRGSGGFGSTGA
jgi:dUTP pyrophosphatase